MAVRECQAELPFFNGDEDEPDPYDQEIRLGQKPPPVRPRVQVSKKGPVGGRVGGGHKQQQQQQQQQLQPVFACGLVVCHPAHRQWVNPAHGNPPSSIHTHKTLEHTGRACLGSGGGPGFSGCAITS